MSLISLLLIFSRNDGAFFSSNLYIRYAYIGINIIISSFLVIMLTILWKNTSVGEKLFSFIQNWLQDEFQIKVLQVVVVLCVQIGSFFFAELLFTDNLSLRGILFQLAPIIGFGTLAFAQVDFLITKIIQNQKISIWLTNRIYHLSLTWIILNLIWLLGTIRSLDGILIFKRNIILCVTAFVLIVFYLNHQFTTDRLSRWILTCSLVLVNLLSLWITNRFNEMSASEIIILILIPALITQFIFLGIILFKDKGKQNLVLANSFVNIKKITIVLSSIATGLVSIALFLQVWLHLGYNNIPNLVQTLFSLDQENNVPAYFSSIILLISAGLLLLIFYSRLKNKQALYTWHWGFLATVFIFLSFDEMFSFHERLIYPIRNIVRIGGVFSYEWVIVAIPLVSLLGISYSRFILHLPSRSRNLIFLAALIFIGGAIGGEMMSGWYASRFGEGDANYIMLTIFEETLEMTGIIIFIHALLQYLYYETKGTRPVTNVKKPSFD